MPAEFRPERNNIMKKAFITLTVIAGMMAAAATVSAAGITMEDAQKKALETVGVREEQVIFKPAEEDMDDGRQIYEIDFFIPGEVKYEFDIDVYTGAIVDQDIDLWDAEDDLEYAGLIAAAGKQMGSVVMPESEITELQAKMIALKDAGFKADEVLFTKCEKDLDDGILQFEVELKFADGTEYDYEINAADGTILSKDMDRD